MTNYDEFKIEPANTGDVYVVFEDFTWLKYRTKAGSIVVKNKGSSNAAKVKIVASVLKSGEEFDVEILAETDVPADDYVVKSFEDYFPRMRILVKSATAGNSTSVEVEGSALG